MCLRGFRLRAFSALGFALLPADLGVLCLCVFVFVSLSSCLPATNLLTCSRQWPLVTIGGRAPQNSNYVLRYTWIASLSSHCLVSGPRPDAMLKSRYPPSSSSFTQECLGEPAAPICSKLVFTLLGVCLSEWSQGTRCLCCALTSR